MTRHTADSITDDELDALYDQLDALRKAAADTPKTDAQTGTCDALCGDIERDRDEWQQRATQAETTLARIHALAERWQYTGDRKGGPLPELRAALGAPPVADGEERQPGGTAVLTVIVTAPTQENANHWATTIRDLINAEHGDQMRLHMTISPAPAGQPERTQP